MDTQINEPAFPFKSFLSNGAYALLNKLILDLKSKLPPEERIYHSKDNASLIYNLFTGKYIFSHKEFKEIYNAISQF